MNFPGRVVPPPPNPPLPIRDHRKQTKTKNNHHNQEQQQQRQHESFGGAIPTNNNSIQNQFALLSNQRDKFSREREQAEKCLQQVQRDLQNMRKGHDLLINLNRQAKQELGQRMERLAMLQDAESRLNRKTTSENRAIRGCIKYSKILDKKKVEATKEFSGEIDPINFKLAALLERRIEKKTERYITVRSVKATISPQLEQAMREKNKPQLLNQMENLSKSVERLKSASVQREEYILLLGQLHKALQQEHERDPCVQANESSGNNMRPDHVDLFYGRSNGE